MQEYNAQEFLSIEWPRRLFLFSIVLFVAALAGFFGLRFGYVPYLENAVLEKENALRELAKKVPAEDQESLAAFYSALLNLKTTLDGHIRTTRFFAWLERGTHPRVFFTKLNLNTKAMTAVLEGIAGSYGDLAEALGTFGELPEVVRFSVSQSQIVDRGVQFKLSIVLNPALFKNL